MKRKIAREQHAVNGAGGCDRRAGTGESSTVRVVREVLEEVGQIYLSPAKLQELEARRH